MINLVLSTLWHYDGHNLGMFQMRYNIAILIQAKQFQLSWVFRKRTISI